MIRRILLLAVLLTVAAAALLLGGMAALQSPPGRRWLARQVAGRATTMIDGTVTIGAIEGNLLSEMTVRGLAVRRAGRIVADIPLLHLTYDLGALLGLRVNLEEVIMTSPRVRIERELDGTWTVARLLRRGGDGAGRTGGSQGGKGGTVTAVRIGELRLVGGTLLYRDRRSGEGYRLDDVNVFLRARAAASGARVRVTHLDARLRRPAVQVRQMGAALAIDRAGGGTMRGRMRLATGASRVAGSLVVRGLSASPLISAQLRIPGLAGAEVRRLIGRDVGGVVSGRVAVRGPLRMPEVRLALRVGGARVRSRGLIDIRGAEPVYTLSAHIGKFDPGLIGGPRGRLDVRAEVAGRGLRPSRLSGTYALRRLSLVVPGVGSLKGSAEVALQEGRGSLAAELAGAGGRARLEGTADLGAGTGTLRLTASGIDPAFLLGSAYRGELGAAVAAELSQGPTRVSLRGRLAPSRVGVFRLRAGAIRASLEAGREGLGELHIDELMIEEATGRLRGSARARLRPAPRLLSATVDAEIRDIGPLGTLLGLQARGEARLHGTAAESAGVIETAATASGERLRVGALSVRRLVLRARGTGAGMESAVIESAAEAEGLSRGPLRVGRAEARASFDGKSGRGRLTFRAGPPGGKATDRFAAAFSLGPPLRVDVTTLDVETPGGHFVAPAPFSLTLERDVLTVAGLRVEAGEAFLAVRGTVGLAGEQDLSLEARKLPLRALAPLVPGRDLEGRLGIDAHLSGSAARPALKAAITGRDIVFGVARLRQLGLDGELHAGQAAVRLQAAAPDGGSVSGRLRLPIDLSLRGMPRGLRASAPLEGELVVRDMRLHGFRALAPGAVTELSGRANGRVTIAGTWLAPRLGGQLSLAVDVLGLRATGTEYRDIAAEVGLAGSEVELRQFEARAGGGLVSARGRFSLAPDGEISARVTAKRFRAVARPDLSARLSGALEVTGTTRAPQVSGEVGIDKLVARPAFLEDPGSVARDDTIEVTGQSPARNAAGEGTEPAVRGAVTDQLGLDIRVVMEKEAWLRRGESNVEMRGVLRIRKERGGAPRIVGTLEAIRGRVAFQGRGFRVAGGQIVFLGGPRIDPSLDLDLRHVRQEYEVILRVSGSASAPRVTLESRPPLPEADVLALLVFGRPVGQLATGQKVALGRQAAAVAASFAAGEIAESVRERLGLDTLEVGAGGGGTVARVGVGTYVAEDVYVSLQQDIGPATARRAEIQYRLTPTWQIEASTDSRGTSGVDVFWKYDY